MDFMCNSNRKFIKIDERRKCIFVKNDVSILDHFYIDIYSIESNKLDIGKIRCKKTEQRV